MVGGLPETDRLFTPREGACFPLFAEVRTVCERMAFSIVPVFSGLDLEAFVDFPFTLYEHSPLWVPPLRSDDRILLSPGLHPFWQTARRRLFVARENGRIIGRIAAIIDEKYNAYVQERCGAFGFFECIDNQAVADGLLAAAAEWLTNEGMDYMRGPVNPSTNYTCAVLVDGFSCRPALMMPWNPPYYKTLLERFGLYQEEDLFAYRISPKTLAEHPSSFAFEERLASSPFTFRTADAARLDEDIAVMLDLYRSSWAHNWYFSPLSREEENELVHELKMFIDRRFFVLFYHGATPAGGMVALPDYTGLLRNMRGRIGLKTPWQYWSMRKTFKRSYRVMLFGVREEYRLFGLPHLLFAYMVGQARKNPTLEWVEGSWVLEDNRAICDLIEDFSGKIVMRYRIYRSELKPRLQ